MIIKQGVDIINIQRIENIYNKYGVSFINKILTSNEKKYCLQGKNYDLSKVAKRFAAKEAFTKALGTGIGVISFQDIEVVSSKNIAPQIKLSCKSKSVISSIYKGNYHISLSLSDDYPYAMAAVILCIN